MQIVWNTVRVDWGHVPCQAWNTFAYQNALDMVLNIFPQDKFKEQIILKKTSIEYTVLSLYLRDSNKRLRDITLVLLMKRFCVIS